ncbi:MAG TPA: hypothetical protein VGM37_06140 [Armatimonadota bacterium]|jgi:hypothetical protein
MRRLTRLAPPLILLAVGASARADAGTPLIWAGFFHLLIGNALIGLFEAAVLKRRYRTDGDRWLCMIPANYFSAWVGYLAFRWLDPERWLGDRPLFAAPVALAMLFLAAYAATIILEWPFCWWIAGPGTGRAAKAWRMSLLAQTASYAILLPLCLLVSPVTVFTVGHVQRNLGFVKEPIATVYYIGDDGNVWSVQTNGANRRKRAPAAIASDDARLALVPAKRIADLCVVGETGKGKPRLVLSGVAAGGRSATGRTIGGRSWFDFNTGRDFRPKAERTWTASTGFWASEGLTAGRADGSGYTLALDTPFLHWFCRSETTLPNGQTVFQLGPQIVILDLPTRRIGFLAKGRGPAVTIP